MKLVALTTILVAPLASAQTAPTQMEALTRLFSAAEISADWFAPDFLKVAPIQVIQQQLSGIATQYGKFVKMDTYQGKPLAVYERGSLIVTSAPLDAQGRFTSFGAVPGPAPSLNSEQQRLGIETLKKLFQVDPLDTSMFSADFLKAVPEDQLRDMMAQSRAPLGAFQGVNAQAQHWELLFEKGKLLVTTLRLDGAGQISGLVFQPAPPVFSTFEQAQAAFSALPGEVSLYLSEVGQPPLLNLNATRPLAVGSTFKLAILGELQAQVQAGKVRWTDEMTLTDALKSLPSGTLQDAPAGTKYTLQDLSTRMIRDSDNTATDMLLNLVGREGVEARLGQPAMPSTREAFALKNPANIELLRAYRTAGLNSGVRRAVLKQAEGATLPTVAEFDGSRTLARDVEWFVSTGRLCGLMNAVAALPQTQVNPGVADRNDFASVSFKGGSEPGVLNLTTQVTSKAGKTYCVSATWNRPEPLNDAQFFGLYSGLLKLLP